MFKRLIRFFSVWGELISQLTMREIKARYKQSILGYAWVVVVPVIRLVVMTIVFSQLVRIQTGAFPYPLFLFTGLVPWTFTSSAVTAATSSVLANASLITKIRMPRIIFPLSSILVKLVDLSLSGIVLLGLMFFFKASIYWTIIFVPFIFLIQFILVLGVSFILAAANVFYRDVENILEVFMMVWMYLTPVIYPPEFIPDRLIPWFNLNPMMGIINAYRNTLLFGVMPPWRSFGWAVAMSLIIFIVGFIFFSKRSKQFADVI